MPRRNKTMKGGFWESLNNAWESTKKSVYGSSSTSTATTTTPYTPPATTTVIGGRKRTSKRGGYFANTPLNGLASTASTFSGKTAQPQNWVGGKTRKCHNKKHTKSCKHKKQRKH